MRLYIIFLFFSLTRSKKPQYDDYEDYYYSVEKESDYVYIPYEKTTLDFRGTLRKRFAVDVALSAEEYGNVICSPVSAFLPLGKLLLGTMKKSKSTKELLSAIGLKRTRDIKTEFRQAIKELEYLRGVHVALASRLYLSTKEKLRKSFKNRAESIYGSSIDIIDASNPDKTAKQINAWVSYYTDRQITDVISAKDIKLGVSLILISAIYFEGQWKYPFLETSQQLFHTPTQSVVVTMMSRTGTFNYINSDKLNAQIIEIPYVDEQAALIVILPNEIGGLPILLRTLKISTALLNRALVEMKPAVVKATIPEFSIESALDLQPYYNLMGLKRLFYPEQSDLAYVVRGNEPIHVSTALQKAVIKVNNKGTTGVVSSAGLSEPFEPKKPHVITFKADHPFVFYVKGYNEQLFSGVVRLPSTSDSKETQK